ncbi:MAG: TolC family protein [Proteobacteria bacterium]|nr:TolC family protein [Pseudomonadota bacterium]
MIKRAGIGVCLLVFCMLVGCFSPTRYGTSLPTQVMAPRYADLVLEGEVRERWWEAYDDPQLNVLIDHILKDNLTLQVAYLRLLDSILAYEQSKSGYYPTLGFSAGLSGGGRIAEQSTADPTYSLGLSLSYEVDIWGKIRAEAAISELSSLSTRDAVESATLSIIGQVVTEWFNVQYYRDRIKLTQQLLEISESYHELVQAYYRTGRATGMDLLEQRDQIETLRSTLLAHETNARLAEQALYLLAGGKRQIDVPGSLPEHIDVGGTVDIDQLLERRPDIRAARRTAQQADARIVVALADRLPTLRLSASLSFRATSLTDLFTRLLWDVAGNFAANLFDGGRRSKALDRAKVGYLQEQFNYGAVVLRSISEVEAALLRYRLRAQELADARNNLASRQDMLVSSRQYFIGGVLDYSRVLSALRGMVSASQAELDARRALLLAQINVFLAMGGGSWLKEASDSGTKRAYELLESLDREQHGENEQDED